MSKEKWIRCESKSKPGLFYNFNTGTGETKWCSQFPQENGKTTQLPPKLSLPRIRTPAQDRLKRLQTTYSTDIMSKEKPKVKSNNSNVTKATNKTPKEKAVIRGRPSTSRFKEKQYPSPSVTSPRKARQSPKPKSSNSLRKEKPQPCAYPKSPRKSKESIKYKPSAPPVEEKRYPSTLVTSLTTMNEFKQPSPSTSNAASKSSPKPETPTRKTTSESDKLSLVKLNRPQKRSFQTAFKPAMEMAPEPNTSIPTGSPENAVLNIGSSIVHRIKDFCSNTLKTVLSAHGNKRGECSELPKPPLPKMPSIRKQNQETNAKLFSPAPNRSMSTNSFVGPSSSRPTAKVVIPLYNKGCANKRLDNLRAELSKRGLQFSKSCDQIAEASSSLTSTSSGSNDVEPMDWQPIDDKAAVIEVSSATSTSSGDSINYFGTTVDTVNENLMRLSAEKQSDANSSKKPWLKDYYYFVLDTNVLLQQLAFVKSLCDVKLCDTRGTVLYIPYCVLQELDKLKMRSNSETVKIFATRAIKFLNSKFETNDKQLQAQNAVDEHKYLIDVQSPDDSILNCCLQVKKNVPNMILLTEDVNMRNKAICNDILVCTKSDLVLKQDGSNSSLEFKSR